MEAFTKDYPSFERLNAQVLGVSMDTVESHKKFAASLGLPFPLLSDPGGAVAKAYGAKGRITYIIDGTGTIRFVKSGMPDNAELLKELEKIAP